MKLDYKKTMIIGLGFFTVNIVWGIYNIAMPLYLQELGLSGVAVGSVMTIDNFFALLFLPIFGALSDRTNSRYGRRMPYLLAGIPLSAVAFFLIPFAKDPLILLMITVIAMNFFMSIYRAPTVALMPDFTPRPLRSKANGVINFMGGIGAVITFLIGGFLFDINEIYPFAAGSLILILTIIIMYIAIHEPEKPLEETEEEQRNKEKADGKGMILSLVFLLLAIFFWFTGYNAVETFFSTYAEAVLGLGKSQSSFMLAVFSGFLVAFAIPSGFLGTKIGRKKTILIGITILILVFAGMIFARNSMLIYIMLALGVIGWAFVNINSYPMVVEMTSSKGIGKYTGYYYIFSMMAAIVSPIFFGLLKDILGDEFLFIYSALAMLFAFFFMMLVKHGEAKGEANPALKELSIWRHKG